MGEPRGIRDHLELAADVLLLLIAFFASVSLGQNLGIIGEGDFFTGKNLIAILFLSMISYVVFNILSPSFHYGEKPTAPLAIELLKGLTIIVVLLLFGLYLLGYDNILFVVFSFLIIAQIIVLARLLVYLAVCSGRRKEYSRRHLLILGSRATAQELIKLIVGESGRYRIVGCLEKDPGEVGKTIAGGVKVIGTLDDLKSILLNQVVDEIIITMPLNEIENADWYLSYMNNFGLSVRIIPDWYMRKFMSKHTRHGFVLDSFLSEPALVINKVPRHEDALLVKGMMDFVLSVVLLCVTLPLFLLLPPVIKAVSPGPVLFSQIRTGLDGRRFRIYKFRTMVASAEELQYDLIPFNEASGPAFKIKDDPRIIPYLGRFLRRFGLDELPQLINVLRGEMSIVGPRPPTPQEVEKYELWQRRRLSMKPGMTCLWQIQRKRNEVPFDRWMDLDMYYIDHFSLGLDLSIIVRTIPAILSGQGR